MRSLLSLLAPLRTYYRFWSYRKKLERLIDRGLKIGRDCYIMEDVEFDYGYPQLIDIGDGCRISKNVRILAHDATAFREKGVTRIGAVKIGEGTFIGERAFILPGVTIGANCMIAANSFVCRDFPAGSMISGNPARLYGKFEDYLANLQGHLDTATFVPKELLEDGGISQERLQSIVEQEEQVFIFGVPNKDPYYWNVDMEGIRQRARVKFKETFSQTHGTIVEKQ